VRTTASKKESKKKKGRISIFILIQTQQVRKEKKELTNTIVRWDARGQRRRKKTLKEREKEKKK